MENIIWALFTTFQATCFHHYFSQDFPEYSAAQSHQPTAIIMSPHPIKDHNRRRSARHSESCLYMGQSAYSSASCRAVSIEQHLPFQISKSQKHVAHWCVRTHAHVAMNTSTRKHFLPDSLTFSFSSNIYIKAWHTVAAGREYK